MIRTDKSLMPAPSQPARMILYVFVMTERYVFSAEADKIDRARVHRWLSEQSYWAQGRSRQKQDADIDA